MNRSTRTVFGTIAAATAGPFVGFSAQAAPVYDPVNDVTYVRDGTAQSWAAARAAAQAAGGDLVRIRSAAANNTVRIVAAGDAWIGASDEAVEGAWRWANNGDQFWSGLGANAGGVPVGGLYSNWNNAEPNDVNGEDFAEITGGGGWNDLPTSFTRPSVRELPGNQATQTFNGRTYYLIAAASWNEASNTAAALGGNLV